jgi:hypothetical protein
MYRLGVDARAKERARKRKLKELQKAKQEIPDELLIPIPDPEMIWFANQEEMACQQQLERQQEEEEVTIVIGTAGDESLQPKEDDYIPFPAVDSDDDDDSSSSGSDGSDDSGVYDPNNDYSWHGRY